MSSPDVSNQERSLIATEDDVTPFVLAAMANTSDARLHTIVTSLVRHLHAFVREVRPTEDEYEAGLRILNSIGQATDDSHNEAVLYCDALGISTLIDLINNDGMQGETMSALLGPFYRGEAPTYDYGESIALEPDEDGAPLTMEGRVLDVSGAPIAGATLDVWQASPKGMYENQDPDQPNFNLRGKFTTDADGRYKFHSLKPAGYPVPTHTPTGDLLRLQKRSPFRPAHLHFIVSAPEHKTLITQIFADTDEAMLNDVVFGAKKQIAADMIETSDGSFHCTYDFKLKPGVPTFPEPPIKGKAV
jgi:catechol 1,2-dioxygenase